MLSAKGKYRLRQVLPFGIIWSSLGALFLWIEQIAMGDLTKTDESAITLEPGIVVYALVGVFLIGCIFGTIHILWIEKLFKNRSFGRKLLVELAVYLLFMEIMILINYPIAASMELDVPINDFQVWERLKLFFWSETHLSAIVQMGVSLFVSLFYHEISNTVGPNVLYNFFTGRYHRPVNEERIFMFVDMKDSTTIAEQLGNAEYFEFLQKYYDTFSSAIIQHQGEVYQYVGDEIVVSWKVNKGRAKNNCVECFFSMKRAMLRQSDSFQDRFGLIPDFKAAVHYGSITTGEIGALKKDIFFTGDVLNTTSRIIGKSSAYGHDLLVSENIVKLLSLESQYSLIKLGSQELKGKKEVVPILAVEKTNSLIHEVE